MKYAVLFPGQGSQHVGMGADVFATRRDLLGDAAASVLGWSLEALCANGPEDQLTATDRAQPALYAVSYALWEAFASAAPAPPAAAAGHSLGEFTALAAAGAIAYADGLRLVAERGKAMAAAADAVSSGMAALLGADGDTADRIAADRRAQGGRLWVANINAPGQIVVAGASEDIDWLVENGRDLGVRRVVPLKVAGAFHSPIMEPARAELERAVASVEFGEAAFPVWANVTAEPTPDPATTLLDQLTGTVRFAESLAGMAAAGVEAFVHVGPGDVTAGMAKRAAPEADTFVVDTMNAAGAVAEELSVR